MKKMMLVVIVVGSIISGISIAQPSGCTVAPAPFGGSPYYCLKCPNACQTGNPSNCPPNYNNSCQKNYNTGEIYCCAGTGE